MPHQLLVPPCETHDRRRASVSSSFSLASSFPSLITADSLNSSLSSPSTDLPISLLTLLPTGHPTPRQLDQASRLPPTPRSRRWERGVGGSLAHDVVLNGGGRGGQLFPAKPGTSVVESHQAPRQQGGSQTRAGGDDFPDEAPNYFADDFADYFRDDFRRLRCWGVSSLYGSRSVPARSRSMYALYP